MTSSVRLFRILSIVSGVLAILVTLGAVGMAAFMGLMLSGSAVDIVIAVWQSLSLGKYFFNAFMVLFCFFTFSSKAAKDNFILFLVPSILMALWNFIAIPHKIAYGYFIFWMIYSMFIYLNRASSRINEKVTATKVENNEAVNNTAERAFSD